MIRFCTLTLLLVLGLIQPVLAEDHSAEALAVLVAVRQADPSSRDAARRLEAFISAGLTTRLQTQWLPSLPVDTTSLTYDLGTLIVPKAYLPTHAVEPQHGWSFARVAYLYLPDAENLRLFCAVHYSDDADKPLALRTARLLALAHQTLIRKTEDGAANGNAPFDVWLCAGGKSGGEQWRDNLYLYDLQTPRSSIEWLREILHEYSHLALPAIGGYRAPEYWANGYLGERLLVRWLMRGDGPARVAAVWGDFSGAPNFERLLIAPPLALYHKTGPSPSWLARTDEAGMRYLIGQALTFDDKYGAVRLGDALRRLPRFRTATAKDFAAALSQTLSASAHPAPP